MLDQLFRPLHRQRILRRIRINQLGQEIEQFSDYLSDRGHTCNVAHQYIEAVEHLGTWMKLQQIPTARLDEEVIARFLRHLPDCLCVSPASHDQKILRAAARQLLIMLRDRGQVSRRIAIPTTPIDREVAQFDLHLAETCGLAHSTRIYCRRYVRQFLTHTFGRGTLVLTKLKPQNVMDFIADAAAVWKPGTAKVIVVSLRSYFRYLQLGGLCDNRLLSAVPTIPQWKLASIPKTVTAGDLRRFLASFDRSLAQGRRDYAMALCMIECGLRTCEVAALHIEDIDWRQATLRVPGRKTRRSRLLPLPNNVGRAIAAYLRNGRPRSSKRGLFLVHRAPRSQATACTVRGALRKAYCRSGATPWRGPHSLRHTMATRMVQGGVRIKDVADVLGHTSIDTTMIYTKVNLPMLKRVALPWPAEAQP